VIELRAKRESDCKWAIEVLTEHWGSPKIVTRGRVHDAASLPGIVAVEDGQPLGLLTYRIDGEACEVVTLNALSSGKGIGTSLLASVETIARNVGCGRVWLVTTNDNTPAIRFYQRRGYLISALHRGAVNQSRKLKPEIPELGVDGIPIRDEIELEKALS